jgi:hypothetical protein
VPNPNWSDMDCVTWGLTGPLGSNPISDGSSSEGTQRFTEVENVGEWQGGPCP